MPAGAQVFQPRAALAQPRSSIQQSRSSILGAGYEAQRQLPGVQRTRVPALPAPIAQQVASTELPRAGSARVAATEEPEHIDCVDKLHVSDQACLTVQGFSKSLNSSEVCSLRVHACQRTTCLAGAP